MIYLESAQHNSNESIIRLYTKTLVLWEYLKDECRLYIDHTVKKADSASFQWEKQNRTETTSHHTKSKNNGSGKPTDGDNYVPEHTRDDMSTQL
uniref:AlNc14C7G918 protein n=1 Tax=Albugo laibachii Nc14 TaxID=890382 RepID=F0W1E9_9STRA|nr:AlNc14C7G918 [Albugo laibachii Nc14]|eukprot:CCA14878.1 AlNc14C7G918 [Albugo laibachii Nc14]